MQELIVNEHVSEQEPGFSQQYRLMIYFAVATMHIYSDGLKIHKNMTPKAFYELNPELMKRVFDEGLSIMNYELSFRQISLACTVYLKNEFAPQNVKKMPPYNYGMERQSNG